MAEQPESTVNDMQETIGKVLGKTPSGVFILTAADGKGHETGMLASWVQQASFDPPAVSLAVNRKRYLNDWLKANPRAVLNIVGETQKNLLGHFGRGFEPEEPAFNGIKTARTDDNLPILADALGYLAGRITGSIDAGDHVVYLLEISAAGAGPSFSEEAPMIHIRKNGFSY